MKNHFLPLAVIMFTLVFQSCSTNSHKTKVKIVGEQFFINGKPTYEKRNWKGYEIEGLLMNSRMVQGIFDDLNDTTIYKWVYPDTKKWDADRNTDEFVRNMELWHSYGLLSFTINMQGGSPQGYSSSQPWYNSAYYEDGSLRKEFIARLEKILDRADELGMIPVLGLFYFGQDQNLIDEKAVISAVNNMIDWLFENKYRNILIEINNECNVGYDHEILQPHRVDELIELVKKKEKNGFRFLAGTSYGGGFIPLPNVVRSSDFILVHGNGVSDPDYITVMVDSTRRVSGYTPKPILFNEDDHFDFEKEKNNFTSAVKSYASWGYFDYRMKDELFEDGYQSVPVDWGINSGRKRGFFRLLKKITGS
ncbi:MAG TPA: hypothetical protein DCP74_06560 [Bacteroidales bacterium]|nr:hypothetical protein [Bacteroidales bacterium]